MSEVAAVAMPDIPAKGLVSRLAGVIFSPRETYPAVVAQPRVLGAFVVSLAIMAACQLAFLSTDVGKDALLERQFSTMERFGVTVTDEMARQMESRLAMAPYTTAASQAVSVPLIGALLAVIALGLCNALLDGAAKFKQVYAIVAHAGIIVAIQQIFNTPLMYARGELASPATLDVFFPMLDAEGVTAGILGAIDLFLIWWVLNLAIGLAVLYKRPTGPIATTLLGVYASIALVIGVAF